MNFQIFHDFATFCDNLIETRPKGRAIKNGILNLNSLLLK